MGIQINGITDTISATDGGLSVSGQELTGVTSINASGIVTANTLVVSSDARIIGILTIGTSSVTLDGTNNQVNVGSGVTIHHTNGVQVSSNTVHSTGLTINNINATGVSTFAGITTVTGQTLFTKQLNVSGVITASSFVGDGSGLTGAGATVANDTATNSTFYPLFTSITSGTVTGTKISTTKLTFNPSTGTLTATDLNSSSDSTLKENIETVEGALDKVNSLHGVKFNWKEDGRVSYGVIAQELEQVLPELVSNNDPKTVNYNGIIAVLIEAVKELTQRVEELENKS